MSEKTKTWLTAAGVAAALSLAALIYFTRPPLLGQLGLNDGDLDGGVLAGLIAWLALRGRKDLSQRAIAVFAAGIGAALLLGFALFFMA